MTDKFKLFLIKLDIFDFLKIIKDRFFKSKNEKFIENKRLEFYSKLVPNCKLFFDVGANYGNRTEVFLRMGSKVITFDPQPVTNIFLKRKFNDKITIEDIALGASEYQTDLFLSKSITLTSMSTEWIKNVSTGRFKDSDWDKKIKVNVSTLDLMINKYGTPDFCKIDVEGFEFEVLKGLSKPIPIISFEFTIPEFYNSAITCLNYLKKLGKIECNFSIGETLEFYFDDWLTPEEFIPDFSTMADKGTRDGDIYVRFI